MLEPLGNLLWRRAGDTVTHGTHDAKIPLQNGTAGFTL
jgi:hypothetical protein